MKVTDYNNNVFVELTVSDAKVLVDFLLKQINDNRVAKLVCKRKNEEGKVQGKVEFVIM